MSIYKSEISGSSSFKSISNYANCGFGFLLATLFIFEAFRRIFFLGGDLNFSMGFLSMSALSTGLNVFDQPAGVGLKLILLLDRS